MGAARLLRTPENPGGYRLSELLRKVRLEVKGEAIRRERGAAYAVALQVAGLLLCAEGVHEAAAAAGYALDAFVPPRLVPPAHA